VTEKKHIKILRYKDIPLVHSLMLNFTSPFLLKIVFLALFKK